MKMEKGGKGGVSRGQATSFGFKRPPACPTPAPAPSLPSVPAAQVTRETIEPLIIAPVQPRQGTPKLGRSKKESGKPANRFGFIPPAVLSNKVSDLKLDTSPGSNSHKSIGSSLKLSSARSVSETRYNKPSQNNISNNLSNSNSVANSNSSINSQDMGRPSRFTLESRTLPKPQAAIRLPTAAHYNSQAMGSAGSTAADKRAKTAANNQTASRSALQLNGQQKVKRNDSVLEIQQLEHSPSLGHKFRHAHTQPGSNQKARPMEMVFNPGPGKRFDLRDLIPIQTTERASRPELDLCGQTSGRLSEQQNSIIAERIRRDIVLPAVHQGLSLEDDHSGEEKQRRDKKASEKVQESGEDSTGDEELWAGPGEAMAMADSMISSGFTELDQSPEAMNPPLRSVLLRIEDPTFATLAALSNSGMLEDEISPESPDISCSSPSSVEPLPPPPANISKPGTPDSPGSPTHATNSLSSDTKDRDFLIDDEIADQPGLVFDTAMRDEPSILDTSRTIAKLAGEVSQVLASVDQNGGVLDHHLHHRLNGKLGSTNSVGTLSPCESLASDDLMADFDKSDLSAFDDLNNSYDSPLKSELINQSDQVMKEWSAILNTHPGLNGLRTSTRPVKSRLRSTSSGNGEVKPRSNLSSPHKANKGTRSPGDDASDDSGIKLDGHAVQHLVQDVVNIKSMLLRLQRILHEPENSGLYEQGLKTVLGGLISEPQPAGEALEVRDLRRQMLLLELEMEEKDRLIGKLQEDLRRANDAKPQYNKSQIQVKYSNAATQTDRLRPLSTTLFQNSPDSSKASFVSTNDTVDQMKTVRPNSIGLEDENELYSKKQFINHHQTAHEQRSPQYSSYKIS